MKKCLLLVLTVALVAAFAACGSEEEENVTPVEQTAIGQITAISGDTITIALGEEMSKQMSDQANDAQPSADGSAPADGVTDKDTPLASAAPEDTANSGATSGDQSTDNTSGDTTAAPPSGTNPPVANGNQPQGQAPGTMIQLNGETLTLTLTDDTVVYLSQDDDAEIGTLDDLAVDDVISITYDANGNTVISITQTTGQVFDADMMNAPGDGAPANGSGDATTKDSNTATTEETQTTGN